MRTGHRPPIGLVLAAAGLLSGCAQTDTIFPRRTSVGSLKTSVSHLEFENEQLRRQVAQLKTETRDVEDRLVQEEADNGDLRARLDDARHLLGQRGVDLGEPRRSLTDRGPGDDDSATTIPAGRSTKKKRKPPFAQIPLPGRIEAVPHADPADDEPSIAPQAPVRDEFGPQGRVDDRGRWLPIAHGTSAPSRR